MALLFNRLQVVCRCPGTLESLVSGHVYDPWKVGYAGKLSAGGFDHELGVARLTPHDMGAHRREVSKDLLSKWALYGHVDVERIRSVKKGELQLMAQCIA
jgi:hypothetical protein